MIFSALNLHTVPTLSKINNKDMKKLEMSCNNNNNTCNIRNCCYYFLPFNMNTWWGFPNKCHAIRVIIIIITGQISQCDRRNEKNTMKHEDDCCVYHCWIIWKCIKDTGGGIRRMGGQKKDWNHLDDSTTINSWNIEENGKVLMRLAFT